MIWPSSGEELLEVTLRHDSWLPSQGSGSPDVAQSSAKDRGEVVAVRGLVPPSRQAFLLQAFQGGVGCHDGSIPQRASLLHLAVLGEIQQGQLPHRLFVNGNTLITNLVPCMEQAKSSIQTFETAFLQ